MFKSELRSTVKRILGDHEISDGSLEEDLVDGISQEVANEIQDDEDGDDEEEGKD